MYALDIKGCGTVSKKEEKVNMLEPAWGQP